MKILTPLVVGTVLGVAAWSSEALGCPNCKEALAQNDPSAMGLVQGYFWSIIFMLTMPFTIFTGMSAYFYLLVRRARHSAATNSAGSNPFRPGDAYTGRSGAGVIVSDRSLMVDISPSALASG